MRVHVGLLHLAMCMRMLWCQARGALEHGLKLMYHACQGGRWIMLACWAGRLNIHCVCILAGSMVFIRCPALATPKYILGVTGLVESTAARTGDYAAKPTHLQATCPTGTAREGYVRR